ncbi:MULTISPECIES: ATP-binding protein [Gordonia]|uniref:AAA family ATPase n=1 Tax=Gordonia amicalis TaxID=89053 RepID=A0AAE4UAH6_9ACTN|nr:MULTISPECIES: AAA family ATPase [Gordonia]ATD69184.1 hypothetical protein CNO18_01555 [Gordonia sp. 1D]MCZ4654229.1 AAA family ATPase [Gordonia amicalis]MDJ0452116.1 AAA family ATPase [Gordonia amicalis]MDV6308187.1 AAA family ATPase [Gordonia amicalis]MDV6312002.1 AAA family ATPase [Gordonia amicalis]
MTRPTGDHVERFLGITDPRTGRDLTVTAIPDNDRRVIDLAVQMLNDRGVDTTNLALPTSIDPVPAGVRNRAKWIRDDEAARALVAAERPLAPLPAGTRLTEFLDEPDDPVIMLIARHWPAHGRVLLYAQRKSGKTTLVANLLRSLADGDPFLGDYEVTPPGGRIILLDDELSPRQQRQWLRDAGITNTNRITLYSLRGRVATLNLLDDRTRAAWATRLRDDGASVVILDCLRPALDALGLSEDKDAGRFLVAFDALLAEAGATEGLIVHHAGHGNERARGDSRLMDWPDALWKLAAEKTDDPFARRYFSAFGRDVAEPERRLDYDPTSRRLTIGGGSRGEGELTESCALILEAIDTAGTLLSSRSIDTAAYKLGQDRGLNITQRRIREAREHLTVTGRLDRQPGPHRSHLYSLITDEQEDSSAPTNT